MVSSSFLRGKLLRSVLHLFHHAFVQCVPTGTGALTGLWLRDGVAWLTFFVNCTYTQMPTNENPATENRPDTIVMTGSSSLSPGTFIQLISTAPGSPGEHGVSRSSTTTLRSNGLGPRTFAHKQLKVHKQYRTFN